MLPLPNLDDQTFNKIVEDARKMIPRIYPEWNDENIHDPGIAFIELLSWIKEMQQYHLDRITPNSEKEFLKLLGIRLNGKSSAKTQISFDWKAGQEQLPEGTKLITNNTVFETVDRLLLMDVGIANVTVCERDAYTCVHREESDYNVQFFAFGERPSSGNSLYIGFNKGLPAGSNIPVYVDLFEEYPVLRNESIPEFEALSPKRMRWEYLCCNDGSGSWKPLDVVRDDTYGFKQSGRITIRTEIEMLGKTLFDSRKDCYWIRASLLYPGCEESPRIKGLLLNTVDAVQRDTLCSYFDFSSSGDPNQTLVLTTYLSVFGRINVQIREGNGWRYWRESSEASDRGDIYKRVIDTDKNECIITFGEEISGNIPQKGEGNIRVICYENSFYEQSLIGGGNGYPGQRLDISIKDFIGEGFSLQIGKMDADRELLWEDWTLTDNMKALLKSHKNYSLDTNTGEVIFGNNEHGMLPCPGEANIRIIFCATGKGLAGNIKSNGEMHLLHTKLTGISARNYTHAYGGREAESLQEAKSRLKRQLVLTERAVTAKDFEEIAMNTPGLRIAKVKAIPNFNPMLRDYSENGSRNCVTITAIPYSLDEKPVPDRVFLDTIKRHIDRHRLVTTRVFTVPPVYIEINITASISVKNNFNDAVVEIKRQLANFLSPLDVSGKFQGWDIGSNVSKKDIYGILDSLGFVQHVEQLTLHARGTGFDQTSNGDIIIVPYGLVYLGRCEINQV